MDQFNGLADSSIGSSLLLHVRQRDPEAWQRIVHVYGPVVFGWCRAAGISEHAAADIGQEVFRAVANGIETFRRDSSSDTFVGWMRQITRFKIADHLRKIVKEPTAPGGSTFMEMVHAVPDKTPESLSGVPCPTIEGERAILASRALEVLKTEFRPRTWQAFWATAVEDRATGDVAADLEMSTMAVRKAKSRVLRRLREEFGDMICEDPV